ncbi:unnamed protein product [Tetraodon nigroviridis]|uniref:(spotted green pufferfish) hypothetical protein n=1 Tax=Tetraodon nigroviridis TaxID=99883 RepID=Q4RFV7_TETNG|nr:unnamed protein product [Tetraodon nigroviridis]
MGSREDGAVQEGALVRKQGVTCIQRESPPPPPAAAYSDRDPDDSHAFSHTRDPAVKNKKRSPPSHRSPSSSQRNPHHSSTTDEQESPERLVQKEKLHAELKQVLSKKRSQFRESTCQLAAPEMDAEPTEEQRVSRNLKSCHKKEHM